MSAQFLILTCYEMAGIGLVMSGEVRHGELLEGANGRTSKGKRCSIVKIEHAGERVSTAQEKSRVTLLVKHIGRSDAKPWDVIFFD